MKLSDAQKLLRKLEKDLEKTREDRKKARIEYEKSLGSGRPVEPKFREYDVLIKQIEARIEKLRVAIDKVGTDDEEEEKNEEATPDASGETGAEPSKSGSGK